MTSQCSSLNVTWVYLWWNHRPVFTTSEITTIVVCSMKEINNAGISFSYETQTIQTLTKQFMKKNLVQCLVFFKGYLMKGYLNQKDSVVVYHHLLLFSPKINIPNIKYNICAFFAGLLIKIQLLRTQSEDHRSISILAVSYSLMISSL